MTDEIKNSETLSGGNISGGPNLNANISASGVLEKGTINTSTKEFKITETYIIEDKKSSII